MPHNSQLIIRLHGQVCINNVANRICRLCNLKELITYVPLTVGREGLLSELRAAVERAACSCRRKISRRQCTLAKSDNVNRDHGLLPVMSRTATATPRPTWHHSDVKVVSKTNRKQDSALVPYNWLISNTHCINSFTCQPHIVHKRNQPLLHSHTAWSLCGRDSFPILLRRLS